MKLYATCRKCRERIVFSSRAQDRGELSEKTGKRIELECPRCGHRDLYHVNEIRAVETGRSRIIGLMIFVLATPPALYWVVKHLYGGGFLQLSLLLGGVVAVPWLIFSTLEKQEKKKVRTFNRYRTGE